MVAQDSIVNIETSAPTDMLAQFESPLGYFMPSYAPPPTSSFMKLLVRFPGLEVPLLITGQVVSRRVGAGADRRLPSGVFLRLRHPAQLAELRELAELSEELTAQRTPPQAVEHELLFDSVSEMAAVAARLAGGETRVRVNAVYSKDQPLTITLRGGDRVMTIDTVIVDGSLDEDSRAQVRLDSTARASLECFGANLEVLPSPFH